MALLLPGAARRPTISWANWRLGRMAACPYGACRGQPHSATIPPPGLLSLGSGRLTPDSPALSRVGWAASGKSPLPGGLVLSGAQDAAAWPGFWWVAVDRIRQRWPRFRAGCPDQGTGPCVVVSCTLPGLLASVRCNVCLWHLPARRGRDRSNGAGNRHFMPRSLELPDGCLCVACYHLVGYHWEAP